ncbi:MAG: DUF2905 domain-containing protein [Rudaea sp.]
MQDIGKLLIVAGLGIVLLGAILLLAGKVPFLGRLPGDFTFSSGSVSCFFPLATMIILSLILTVIVNVIARLFR